MKNKCWHDKPNLVANHAEKMYVCDICWHPKDPKEAKATYKATMAAEGAHRKIVGRK